MTGDDWAKIIQAGGGVLMGSLAAFLGTARNRQKMGEVQKERQKPVVDAVAELKQRLEARDGTILELSDRLASLEGLGRRTARAVGVEDVSGVHRIQPMPVTDPALKRFKPK